MTSCLMTLCWRQYETPAELRNRQWRETVLSYLSGTLWVGQGAQLKRVQRRCEEMAQRLRLDRTPAALELLALTNAAASLAADLHSQYVELLERYRKDRVRICFAGRGLTSSTGLEVASSSYASLDWELRRGHTKDDEITDPDVQIAEQELTDKPRRHLCLRRNLTQEPAQ